jgi:hypothetical protein
MKRGSVADVTSLIMISSQKVRADVAMSFNF